MKIIEAAKVPELIKDGANIGTTGFLFAMVCDHIFDAIEESFLETGHPRDIELTSFSGLGLRKAGTGLDKFAHPGMIRGARIGHMLWAERLRGMITNNEIYCNIYPLGCLTQLVRDMGAGKPGIISKIGLGTFIDPRVEGGRANSVTETDTARLMEIDGEEYLYYPKFPIDVAILRGTSIDPRGNVTMEDEAMLMDAMSYARAAKQNGGIVIVQVKRLAEEGELDPRAVQIPGVMVDYAVVAPPEKHLQTATTEYNAGWAQKERVVTDEIQPAPLNVRKVLARRAAMELSKGDVINLGAGIPEVVGAVAAEEGFADDITMTVECGHVGGLPMSGLDFGACYNPDYVTTAVSQAEWYDGGGLDVGILGFAEVDGQGSVNASKFGTVVGPGGFMDIATGTKKIVFVGTLTAVGLKTEIEEGKIRIVQEGRKKKFVPEIEQITFSGPQAVAGGQVVMYITERAVFRLTEEGLLMTEIAPGIDLETEVLEQIDFDVIVSPDLKEMDPVIFREEKMGI